MWNTVKTALKALAGQKKMQAAVLAGITWAVGKLGIELTTEQLIPIVGPLWLYIFSQGLADFGKEAKKIEAKAGV